MNKNTNIFTPAQPYFVMASESYYKYIIMKYGISHFYSFTPSCNINNIVTIIPDGCIDIIFRCGISRPEAFIYGTVLKWGTSEFLKEQHYFGVRFLPGRAFLPKNMPISELINSNVSLCDVMNDKEMIEKITHSTDFRYQIKVFMEAYLKEYSLFYSENKFNIDTLSIFLLDEITKSNGDIKLETLAEKCGYTTRYLNKKFTEKFGISPKVFCRFMRFQNFISELNYKDKDDEILNIALDCGYFDQSHLTKDFRTFTNTTPKKYLKELENSSYSNKLIIL